MRFFLWKKIEYLIIILKHIFFEVYFRYCFYTLFLCYYMKLNFPVLLFFFPTLLFAQVGGENIYQFLNISTSARQIALGGEVLTFIDDVNQPIWNRLQ